MKRLSTPLAESLYERIRPALHGFLRDVDAEIGLLQAPVLEFIKTSLELEEARNTNGPDELFDDLYVLRRYVNFFDAYGQLWRLIANGEFADSWRKLQDALDYLRLVRRFSHIDISALENQLIELEKTYPYNVFFSIGAIVERFECSICGEDIDSFQCPHRKGQLYRGRMATGIARGVVNFDHVAMVDQPEDRRCVVNYEDSSEQFKLVRLLSTLLKERRYAVSDFGLLCFSKRLKLNPEYQKLGRNELCYCGSGTKFKRCCIERKHIEGDHVDITPQPVQAERAVA